MPRKAWLRPVPTQLRDEVVAVASLRTRNGASGSSQCARDLVRFRRAIYLRFTLVGIAIRQTTTGRSCRPQSDAQTDAESSAEPERRLSKRFHHLVAAAG